ncbi:MAG: DUF4430 domain-containing protein [Oscillospiraceae bacterium]|nr:DUF4430 domain-containing protein [Oscillospiraceae bacterium]
MNIRKIVSAAAAAVFAAGAVSVCAFADGEPAGYVYFMAEKTVIGQGFTVEPVKVPYYEGENGLDVVERAAEVKTEDTGYGAFITAFADDGDAEAAFPEAVAAVCPETAGRTEEGWLSAYDYTAESGWTYFVNDEYAQVGIADYTPADGDVIVFSFTVYGYGADLGVDNSSWGGAAALRDQVKRSELVKLFADNADMLNSEDTAYVYTAAGEALAQYEATQEDIDNAAAGILNAVGGESQETAEAGSADTTAEAPASSEVKGGVNAEEKGSPSTGVEGVAVAVAVVILAGAGIALSKKQ